MKRNMIAAVIFICCLFFIGCSTAPEKYFDQAVLNTNLMAGFAGNGLERELEQPSAKMVDGNKDITAPMKRKEVVDDKIKFFETALGDIKNLKETDDTKELLQASIALHEFVLPVYKNEYVQLAKLYDENAPKEQVQSLSASIHDKYFNRFQQLFNKLTAVSKPYAARHNIKVNWME